MKKKWRIYILMLLSTPVMLLFIIAACLYLPPVQKYLQEKISQYASESTGLDISIGKINLDFPLVLNIQDVLVTDHVDTLLSIENVDFTTQLLPLLKGRVEIDKFNLEEVQIDTKKVIDGVEVKGSVHELNLVSRGVDFNKKTVRINSLILDNSNIKLVLREAEKRDSVPDESDPIEWAINVDEIAVDRFDFRLEIPEDTIYGRSVIDNVNLKEIDLNLAKELYSLKNITVKNLLASYRQGAIMEESRGFNPMDLKLYNMNAKIDSIQYQPDLIQANIRNLNLLEKSGLTINSLRSTILIDSKEMAMSNLFLRTPYSFLKANIRLPKNLENPDLKSLLDIDFGLNIKEVSTILNLDILEPDIDWSKPLMGRISASGNVEKIDIADCNLSLEDAFNLTLLGRIFNVNASNRSGQLNILGDLYDLTRFNCLLSKDGSIILPKGMVVKGDVALQADDVSAELELNQSNSNLYVRGGYNLTSEKYELIGKVDSLDLSDMLLEVPIKRIDASLDVKGRYLDLLNPNCTMNLNLSLDQLIYDKWNLGNVKLLSTIEKSRLTSKITSSNAMLSGAVYGDYLLNNPDLFLDYTIAIDELDMYKLGLVDRPIDRNVHIEGSIKSSTDSIKLDVNAEDFNLKLRSNNSLDQILADSDKLLEEFILQLKDRRMNYKGLQQYLPTSDLSWKMGEKSLVSSILKTKGIAYKAAEATVKTSPESGITGLAMVHKAKIDSLMLDTLSLRLLQDTTKFEVKAGVINKYAGYKNDFNSYVTAILRERSGSVLLEFKEGDNKQGLLFGVDIEPQKGGVLFSLIPDRPIIAFKKFGFRNFKNRVFVRDDLRFFAEVDMLEDKSVGFRMESNLTDTVSRQNMNVELRRLNLQEIVNLFPFLPTIGGYVSSESHYIQSENSLRLSTDVFLDSITYENRSIGNFGLGFTWLPVSHTEDLVDIYLSHNKRDVLFATGSLNKEKASEVINVNANLSHFPLSITNVLFPNEEIRLDGDIDGNLFISGSTDKPKVNGEIVLDSVSVYAKQADAYFLFDSRPVKIVDNKIIFKDFSIYTTENIPFKINGTVDITDLADPVVDLKLVATGYPLLDAKRNEESLVYGKMFVDVNATVKGLVSGLKMRGNMSILNRTDITYVLTESPLTVQDRLGDLVTFTSFKETNLDLAEDSIVKPLGGIDMVMGVHIDPLVQFKVDLSVDRSSRVELKGGGDLSLQYNPQIGFSLIGRYTLSGGLIKYSLPIIPSKEFKITPESYIEWAGKLDEPRLNLVAKDRVRASVTEADGASHMVNFDVIIGAKNKLEDLELIFDLEAPESAYVQNQLATMSKEERNKQAIGMLATGVYLAGGSDGKGGLDMGTALNSVLQSQINAIAGSSLKSASLSVGVEEYDLTDSGKKRTDYSFSYAQRFMNDRIQIVVGGRVKTGEEVSNDIESIIDNVSIEYRLDASGTRYVRVFHNKNYESVLEGEITETGVGLVLRKKLNRIGELFIFKRRGRDGKSDKK